MPKGGLSGPRDLFGVAVRILAVWFWTEAAYWGFWAAAKSANADIGNPAIKPREDVAYMMLYLLLGIALMVGCRALVWLAYGDAPAARGADGLDSAAR